MVCGKNSKRSVYDYRMVPERETVRTLPQYGRGLLRDLERWCTGKNRRLSNYQTVTVS